MVGARSQSVATGWWDTSVAGTSGARENSPGLKADGLGSVGGPVKSRWEGNAPTDYSRRVALPETARRDDHSVAPGATDRFAHCEKHGVPNLIRPEACGRHDRETVTQVDGQ